MIYLDHASTGIPSPTALALVTAELERLRGPRTEAGSELALRALDQHERARSAAAELVGVPPERIALIASTTQGLALLAAALELPAGANLIIPAADFLSVATVWRSRHEPELRLVRDGGRGLLPERFADLIDDRTMAIVTSAVQEVSGERVDLDALGRLAREADALLIVDGIQEAGALVRKLDDAAVDAYVTGGHKWLRNPFGLGFMALGPRLLERSGPLPLGYLALEPPAEGWDTWLAWRDRTVLDHPPARPGAVRFELGGLPSGIAALGLEGALRDLAVANIATIERRVLELGARLRGALAATDGRARALGPPDAAARSGITTVTLAAGAESERRLLERLREGGVIASLRAAAGQGGVRFATHALNDEADVDTAAAIVAEHVGV